MFFELPDPNYPMKAGIKLNSSYFCDFGPKGKKYTLQDLYLDQINEKID